MELITKEDCKKIISKLGIKLGVSPRLIGLRLLSNLDKNDMMAGDLSIEALESNICVWMNNGMPNYANGLTIPMKYENWPMHAQKAK